MSIAAPKPPAQSAVRPGAVTAIMASGRARFQLVRDWVEMRLLGSAALALVVLIVVDEAFNNGRYWEAAVNLAQRIGQSIIPG